MIWNSFFILITYLAVSSISSAVLLSRYFGLPDPRTTGSHNPGATNVLRLSENKQIAGMVLLADMLKGFIPVIVAKLIGIQDLALGLVALASILGHIFPAFYRFQGGKGVATTLGALFGLSLLVGSLITIVWISIALIFRYSSLASIIAVISAPILCVMFSNQTYFAGLLLASIIILIKHWENVIRLIEGREPKMQL